MELSRSNSFESIPDVDFIINTIETELASLDISEFKRKESAGLLLPEPLLIPDNSRFVLFPIQHSDVSIRYFTSFSSILDRNSKDFDLTEHYMYP